MDIFWYGQACFKVKGKSASFFIDPYDPIQLGLKLPKDMTADVGIQTHDHFDHSNLSALPPEAVKITGPGQYEIKGIAVTGVSTFHDNNQGAERGRNTIYNIELDGVNIVHLGDLGQKALTEEQLEELGPCNILMIPVGGTYTIDAKDAANIVTQLEPQIVIPMHYGGLDGLKVELEPVDNFLKEMALENAQPIPKLSITKDKLPSEVEVVVLSKS
jgi:L-ascorbate metabolism protein UlaG (beta-lactamase superfamily)